MTPIMNLHNIDVAEFLAVLDTCEGNVYLVTNEGDKLNLRSKLCQLVGLTKLIEGCGALVVSDRYCFGSTPGREVIELNDEEDLVYQICRHYMQTAQCARYMSEEKIQQRRDTADQLARDFHADGIIYEQMKFCDFWAFERPLASHILTEEYGWPVLSIDRPYRARSSGQLRTRFQAFVEALEIKRIQSRKEASA